MVVSLFVLGVICVIAIANPVIDLRGIREEVLRVFWLSMLGCLMLGGRAIWSRPPAAYWFVVLGAAFAAPFVLFAHAFGQFNLFSLLFHMEFGTEGASLAGLEDSFAVAVLGCGFFALCVLWTKTLFNLRKPFLYAMFVVIVAINPITRFGLFYYTAPVANDILSARIAAPVVRDAPPKPDVMVIYLEGIERGFADREIYGDVYAPLDDWIARGVEFTNVDEVEGTQWSIAGLAATLCGLPLLPNGLRFRNNFTDQAEFLTDHTCLSDILAEREYNLSFLKGTDKSFAGFDHMLTSHGFADVMDKQAIAAKHPEDEVAAATAGWTIDDQLLLKTARAEYLAQTASPDPIAMMIETIGPHGTSSALSRDCSDDGQAHETTDVVAAVECTLDAVGRFLTFLDDNRQDRPTVVLLMSDHLNHSPKIMRDLDRDIRRNTVVFIGLGFESPVGIATGQIAQHATMLDVYPTTLAWLGLAAKDARAGLGVSLFGTQKTLIEEFGRDGLDAQLIPNPALSQRIWGN